MGSNFTANSIVQNFKAKVLNPILSFKTALVFPKICAPRNLSLWETLVAYGVYAQVRRSFDGFICSQLNYVSKLKNNTISLQVIWEKIVVNVKFGLILK